jgi:hypothetical protein
VADSLRRALQGRPIVGATPRSGGNAPKIRLNFSPTAAGQRLGARGLTEHALRRHINLGAQVQDARDQLIIPPVTVGNAYRKGPRLPGSPTKR